MIAPCGWDERRERCSSGDAIWCDFTPTPPRSQPPEEVPISQLPPPRLTHAMWEFGAETEEEGMAPLVAAMKKRVASVPPGLLLTPLLILVSAIVWAVKQACARRQQTIMDTQGVAALSIRASKPGQDIHTSKVSSKRHSSPSNVEECSSTHVFISAPEYEAPD